MGEQSNRRYLMHLIRLDGSSLFLHPFTEQVSMIDVFSEGIPQGLFGHEPPIERIRMFRTHLHSIADHDAKAYALDRSFLSRFLASSVVFLVAYSAAAALPMVVIPGIIATSLAFAAALSTYAIGYRRASRSSIALSRCTALRRQIDEIRFDYSDLVSDIEQLLHEMEQATQEEILHFLRRQHRERAKSGSSRMERPMSGLEYDLVTSLEKRLRESGAMSVRRHLARWIESGGKRALEQTSDRLSRRQVDLPLLALYWQLKHRAVRSAQAV
ncbi:MAG: hypothetical protein ACLFM0_07595 [Spirochaetales bacterium]